MPVNKMFGYLPYCLSTEELKASETHTYIAEDHSILKRLFMDAYWNWCMRFVPEWIAPNLITLIGFIFLFVNYFMALLYAYIWQSSTLPRWLLLLSVLSMFIYQTMDNLDGKQARRMRAGSVFGEVFDHGCDSLFLTLSIPSWHLSLGSNSRTIFYHLIVSTVAFYMAHMEEYYTRVLVMGPIQNPTEAQFFIFLIYILTSIFGPNMWTKRFFIPQNETQINTFLWGRSKWIKHCSMFRIIDLISVIITISVAVAIVSNFKRSFSIFRSRPKLRHLHARNNSLFSKKKNLSCNSPTSPLRGRNFEIPSPSVVEKPGPLHQIHTSAPFLYQDQFQHPFLIFMPILILTGSILLWVGWSSTNIFVRHPFYFYAIYGLISSHLCIKLILARICKTKFRFPALVLVPLLGVVNVFSLRSLSAPILSEEAVLYISTVLTAFIYWYFVISVFLQFRKHYQTEFLTIRPAKKQFVNQSLS